MNAPALAAAPKAARRASCYMGLQRVNRTQLKLGAIDQQQADCGLEGVIDGHLGLMTNDS